MKINVIRVAAKRVVPHPTEGYANLQSEISLEAALDPADDVDASIRALQVDCENRVQEHMDSLRDSIIHREEYERYISRVTSLENQLSRTQRELDEMKKEEVTRPLLFSSERGVEGTSEE